MAKITVRLRMTDSTKGALIYSAIDGAGVELGMRDVAVSKIYVRKDKIEGEPPYLECTLEPV